MNAHSNDKACLKEGFDLEFVLAATQGKVLSEKAKGFSGVGTDSRVDLNQKLFIPLIGENFDGHDYLEAAIQKGASGILVHDCNVRNRNKVTSFRLNNCTVILVPDTLKALQQLGHGWRKKQKAKILALTGSNGKTTTKEFVATLLKSEFSTQFNKGSLNNHWGVPLNLLELESSHEMCVVEMGMNHAGEIADLVNIADPDIVMCTTVGKAHIEAFGSVEKIAQAKQEIYKEARPEAIRIYNLDNPFTLKMYQEEKNQIFCFSSVDSNIKSNADVSFRLLEAQANSLSFEGHIGQVNGQAKVEVFGVQNINNLMAAATMAYAAGLSPEKIWQALPLCKTTWGRNQWVKLKNGAQMIFDGYNANPDSMAALFENIKILSCKRKRLGVFGEMRELGSAAEASHFEAGCLAGQSNLDVIWFSGPHAGAFGDGVRSTSFSKKLMLSSSYDDSLAIEVASMVRGEDIVFVKGSRGNQLERFVLACNPIDFNQK